MIDPRCPFGLGAGARLIAQSPTLKHVTPQKVDMKSAKWGDIS